jgi:hypothetical protein
MSSDQRAAHADHWPLGTLGGGRRDRTDDPLLAKQVLSQLSYAPSSCDKQRNTALLHALHSELCGGISRLVLLASRKTRLIRRLVGQVGIEPTTPALSRRCSNRLSY